MNKFADFFYNQPKTKAIHKWVHYFDIYDKHFNKFKSKNPVILEIGVQNGGSLDMWNYYFDNNCKIYGVDIDQNCKKFEKDNIVIHIGDQGDEKFWDWTDGTDGTNGTDGTGGIEFDIIIDDGGHFMNQQITTFEVLYDKVKNGGVYLCEDTHTSYWPAWDGGLLKKDTFIEYTKNFVDLINAYHINNESSNSLTSLDFRKKTSCISYYDSIVVLDKKIDNEVPYSIIKN